MFSITHNFLNFSLIRMAGVICFLLLSGFSYAANECPQGTFASVYENRIYQVRYVTCQKKIKKKYVKHGPTSKYDNEGKLLSRQYFLDGKPAKESDFPPVQSSIKFLETAFANILHLQIFKTTTIFLRHLPEQEIKVSDNRVINLSLNKKNKTLLVTGQSPGKTLVEFLDKDGRITEAFNVEVFETTSENPEMIRGRNENVYFFSQLKNNELKISRKKFLQVIFDKDVEKITSWDESIVKVIYTGRTCRLQALNNGETHVRIFFKNQEEFERLDLIIGK